MKIVTNFKKLTRFIPFMAILILSLLPVFYTWGRLPIWGDTIIPFNSAGLEKYLYQWISLQNGQYFSINYFPYYFFYRFIELFTYNVYLISATILFSLKVIAGLGIYKLSKLLFDKERAVLYTLPVVFYLLSPAQLNASYYLYIYSFAPWFLYFVFKIIKLNKILVSDLIWLSVILFFSSINLPNPKYVFHLFTISIIIFVVSFFFKFININFFFKNFGKLIIFFLLSAYLILPQLVFVNYYSPEKYNVHIKAGYKDVGQMMDFGEATFERMFKLHKDSLNLNYEARNSYKSNALINFLSYLFVILIIANIIFVKNIDDNRKKYQYILLLLVIVYLFFAVGPNPPLGFLYQRMVESFSPLAFLRTTAGATFFLSIFYALLLFPVVLNQKTIRRQNLIFGLLIIAFCIVGYPLLTGESYKNVKVVSPDTDITKHGIIIPKDYFDMQEQLNSIKTDVKILYTGETWSYITTNWGFFGPSIYNFIYNTNNVDCKKINNPLLFNIGFIFIDKSLYYPQSCPLQINKEDIVKQTDFIELSKIPDDLFLPHFYIPQNIIYSNSNIESLLDIVGAGDNPVRSAIFLSDTDNAEEARITQVTPKITFVKINPTKYRVKVENAKNSYTLVFLENFHRGWKLYINKTIDDQQYGEIVASYFNGEIKEGTHKNIFLDKNIFETWDKKPLTDDKHLLVNGYANSWFITPDDTGGKENYELIVEFQPQRLFYLGLFISGTTLFCCIGYLGYDYTRSRRKRRKKPIETKKLIEIYPVK